MRTVAIEPNRSYCEYYDLDGMQTDRLQTGVRCKMPRRGKRGGARAQVRRHKCGENDYTFTVPILAACLEPDGATDMIDRLYDRIDNDDINDPMIFRSHFGSRKFGPSDTAHGTRWFYCSSMCSRTIV